MIYDSLRKGMIFVETDYNLILGDTCPPVLTKGIYAMEDETSWPGKKMGTVVEQAIIKMTEAFEYIKKLHCRSSSRWCKTLSRSLALVMGDVLFLITYLTSIYTI